MVCEVWMVLVVCEKLDGVRWAGSSEYMACSTRFDEVFRVCVNSHPIEAGSVVLAMSTTSIVCISDCLYIICLHVRLHVCVYDSMEGTKSLLLSTTPGCCSPLPSGAQQGCDCP